MHVEPGKTAAAVPVPLDAELQVGYDDYKAEGPELVMSLEKLSTIRVEVDAAVAAIEDLSGGAPPPHPARRGHRGREAQRLGHSGTDTHDRRCLRGAVTSDSSLA